MGQSGRCVPDSAKSVGNWQTSFGGGEATISRRSTHVVSMVLPVFPHRVAIGCLSPCTLTFEW